MFIRYNAIAKIWEYDSTSLADNPDSRIGDGKAPWLPLPIDFSQLVNVPATVLPANVALIDVTKTWTAAQKFATGTEIRGLNSVLTFIDQTQVANSQIWQILNIGGNLRIRALNDAADAELANIEINKAGAILAQTLLSFNESYLGLGIYERSRSVRMGEWQAYTPTWLSTGTQPVIGNGSLVGRYSLVGKTCHFKIWPTFGSTTTYGTGQYFFSLPIAAFYPGPSVIPLGNMVTVSGGGGIYRADGFVYSGDLTNCTALFSGTGSALTSIYPYTWVNTDYFRITGSYEIA